MSLIVAIALLVTVAHGLGHLVARLRQRPVIGEIAAGLVLRPTRLGTAAARVEGASCRGPEPLP